MSDFPDLLSIGSGGKLSSAPAQNDADPAILTVLGEAGSDPEGQRAVASVIANRIKNNGVKPADLVANPKEGFEAYKLENRPKLQKQYPVSSDAYQAALANVGGILSGDVAAPYAYDSFYSPTGQKALGRVPPNWEDGSGVDIGGNRFFTGKYQPSLPDLLNIAGRKTPVVDLPDAATAGRITAPGGVFTFGDTGEHIPSVQSDTIKTLQKAGLLKNDAEPGSINLPWVQRNSTDIFKPGEWYIAPNGQLNLVPDPNAEGNAAASSTAGLAQGALGDSSLSFARFAPGTSDSELRNVLQANQLIYNATHQGDRAAQAGRFVGQTAITLPVGGIIGKGVGLGGSLLARSAPVLAPAIDFAAGRAGGNLLLRGGSLLTRGAEEGALQGALTSGANPNESVGAQMLHGAEAGGALNTLIPGAGAVVRGAGRLLEPFTDVGRNKLVDRFIAERAAGGPTTPNLTNYVPGSTPTLAQATANPGLATLERGVKAVNPTPFESLTASNQQARELALDAATGDKNSLDALIAARSAQTDPMRQAAFANTRPVDPRPVVDAIDKVLAGPSGQRDAVVNSLSNIRSKLVKDDGSLQTDPEQLWGIRQAMGDMLSPLSAGTKADGRLASRELMGVRDALDPVIESGAPGFKAYLDAYSDASGKIDAQDYLQGLRWTDSKGNITLGRVDNAINQIETRRGANGSNPAKNIPDSTMQSIYALRDDLRRQANSDLGRGSGSDTVQKLATNQLVDTLAIPAAFGLGAHGPVGGAALALGKMAYGAKNRAIMDTLTDRLVNPTSSSVPALSLRAPNKLLTLGRNSIVPLGAVASNNLLFGGGAP